MASFVHSRFLFIAENGTPLHFSLPPCSTRRKLKPYIEHGGGAISSNTEGTIKLVPSGVKVHSEGYIKSSYIMDCVAENKLLNMEKYRLAKGDMYESDDDELLFNEPQISHCIRATLKDKCGRKKYLLAEDMDIIHYIISEHAYDEVGGNQIWKKMELARVTSHTWQSMRDRYLKTILPQLHTYSLTSKEKHLLKSQWIGNTNEVKVVDSPRTPKTNSESGSETLTGSRPNPDDLDCDLLEAASASQTAVPGSTNLTVEHPLYNRSCPGSPNSLLCKKSSPKNQKSPQKCLALRHSELKETSEVRKTEIKSGGGDDNDDAVRKQSPKTLPNHELDLSSMHTMNIAETSEMETQSENKIPVTKRCSTENEMNTTVIQQSRLPKSKRYQTRMTTSQLEVLDVIEKWLGLTRSEMIEALYRTNGVVDDAVHWIIHGTRQNGMPVWNEAADNLVLNAPDTDMLLKSYTSDEINSRLNFILQNR